MDARTEKMVYRVGTPIPIVRRRELGVCRWGHPFYVVEDQNGQRDYSGENVVYQKIQDPLAGWPKTFCAACHRAELRASKLRKKNKRTSMDRRNRLRREGKRRRKEAVEAWRGSIGSGP